jgi:diguanylate cyclase (GGDEF)-like protein
VRASKKTKTNRDGDEILIFPEQDQMENNSLRRSVKAYAAIITGAIVLLVIWGAFAARAQAISDARMDAGNMAAAAAQQARLTIESVDNVLVGIARVIDERSSVVSASAGIDDFLGQRAASLTTLKSLFILDEEGKIIATSEPGNDTAKYSSFYDVLYRHKHSENLGLYVGGLVKTSDGTRFFTLSRRLNHENGSFAGTAFATIDLDSFVYFYDALNLGEKGSISLLTDSGMLIVRHPFVDTDVGSDIHDSPLFKQITSTGSVGTVMLPSRLDGVERIHSYQPVGPYPLIVAATLSFDDVLRQWKLLIIQMVAAAVIVIALLWIGTTNLIKGIGRGEKARAQLVESEEDLKKANEQLGMLALHDGLTGLANRRRFDVALKVEFARAMRSAQPLSLILIDIDYFKKYNDTYGHQNGDVCLRAVSDALAKVSKRPGDLVARYGGEEIAVLLPSTDDGGAVVVAEEMRLVVRNLGLPHSASEKAVVTISAGVASMVPDKNGTTAEHLVRAADRALYVAKEKGRDRVCTNNATVVVLM